MERKIVWPDGKSCALALTFDFTAEALRASRALAKGGRMGFGDESRGQYGPHEGLKRCLDMLDALSLKATFFIPTETIEAYPECVKAIADMGHEIAYEGERAEFDLHIDREIENEKMAKAEALIESFTGRKPVGHRMKEVQEYTPQLLSERGYLYSSSLHDTDWAYINKEGVVELPTDIMMDDSTYFYFTFAEPANRSMYTCREVMDSWKDEFDALSEEKDKIMVLTLHPHMIGRGSRIAALTKLLSYMKDNGAWIATCEKIASYVKEASS